MTASRGTARESQPSSGDVLAGRFRLGARVEQFGATEVFEGIDASNSSNVLLRSLRLDGFPSGLPIRLAHEAAVLARLNHPHLVPLVFQGREEGRFWLVTRQPEDGVTLKARLQAGPLSTMDAISTCLGVLAGLAELHRHGILHTGIQPSDIICIKQDAGTTSLLSWPGALELLLCESSSATALLDVSRYSAPERSQIICGEVSESSDLYSVGCLLFHSLVGHPPYDGADLNQLLWHQATQPLRGPRELGVDVPRALDELLQRLLAREVHARYQTAEAVRHDLENLLAGLRAGIADPDLTIGAHDHRGSLARPAFVARQAEVAILDKQIELTRAGAPQLTVVEGQSGYGKTRLLSEFAVRCTKAGLWVFEGRATPDVGQPFQLFEGVAASFLSAAQSQPRLADHVNARLQGQTADLIAALPTLARVLRSEETEGPPVVAGESRLLAAMADFLDALGTSEHPAVVILDDVQWADDLLYRMMLRWQVLQAQRPGEKRYVQLVVAYRSDEVSETNPLRRIEPGVRIGVGPLKDSEILRLLESMAGPLPPPAVEVVTRLADGSPFMASAILHGLVESRALISESQTWKVDLKALDVVRSSRHAAAFLARRLSQLDPVTLAFLEAGALLGSEFSLEMAVTLSELPTTDALNAANDARQRHLLWWNWNDVCAFVHDKIRETLLERQAPEKKTQLHSRAADHLLKQAVVPHAELAIHLDAAGRSEEALQHALVAAADAREQHALELSENLFRIAERAAVQKAASIRFQIAEGLGSVQMLRGRYAEAGEQFNRAADFAEGPESRAEVSCKRGELSIKRGDMHAALAQYSEGLRTIGFRVPVWRVTVAAWLSWEILVQALHTVFHGWFVHRTPRPPDARERLAMRMLSGYAHACWYCRSLPLAMWAHLRCMNRGETYAPTLELAQAYSDHAPAMVLLRWIGRGTTYAERSLAIRRDQNDLWGQGQSLHYYGVVQYAAGRYDECIELCGRAVRILERLGDYWQVHIARYQIAAARLHLGDLRGAADESQRNHASGMMVGDEQASGIILDVWARATAGRVPADLLQRELARERHDAQGTAQVLLASAVQDLYLGEALRSVETLERARTIVETSGVRNPYTLPVYVWLATASRIVAERDHSLDLSLRRRHMAIAESALRVATRESWRFRNDLSRILREKALLAVMRGRPSRARRLFNRSLAKAESHRAPHERALTLSEMARVAAQQGWSDAEALQQSARTELARLSGLDQPRSGTADATAQPSVSLIDRFDTLLKTGRVIVSSFSKDTICEKLTHAAKRLLRAEQAQVVWFNEGSPDERGDWPETLEGSGILPPQTDASGEDESRSALRAPIQMRGKVVAALNVVHNHVAGLFGSDEERIAGFLATLAGAAFENAEGFAKLEQLNATLERKVADRTASLQERAKQLAQSNQELERTTAELRVTQDQLLVSKAIAESANVAKGRFLAAMSHEIRTPMNGVIGMAELALATELSNRQRTYVSTISQSAKALLAMLNDVLDFSKIEAGKLELESRPFPLHETIVESVRLLSVSAWQKGLDISTRLSPSLPATVVGDSARLRQVLLNLIGNAVKFTSCGGIDVRGEVDADGSIHLVVRDSGIGIPRDRLDRIFQAFDQGEASITRRFGGTGLGLAISSQIVSLMGGRIWVESEFGHGSEFHIAIPTRLPDAAESVVDVTSLPLAGKGLVFSSKGEVGSAHSAWLDAWGLTPSTLNRIDDVKLALVGWPGLDVLLFDVSANADDEMEVLAQIAKAGLIDVGRIVTLLPAGAEEAASRAQQAGMTHVLMKPVSPRDLHDALASAMSGERKVESPSEMRPSPSEVALRILVVDDSPINQEVAVGLLDLMGHQAMAAESGQDALDLLRDREFDVVFMDVEMPEMDGFETTRRLRARERSRRVPVLAMSAHVMDEVRQDCLAAGMDGFVSKPVDPEEIRDVLAEIVQWTRSNRGVGFAST